MEIEPTEPEPPPESPEAMAFQRFLARLSPEPEEAGRRYIKMRNNLLRYFILKGEASPEEAADETIDRIAASVNKGVVIDEVWPYCLGVARLVGLERFRKNKREQQAWMVFTDKIALTFDEARDASYQAMLRCLQSLEEPERQLLIDYCHPVSADERPRQRIDLAKTHNSTLNQLRLRIYRLRARLLECVKRGAEK
jgi:hypothetical protein